MDIKDSSEEYAQTEKLIQDKVPILRKMLIGNHNVIVPVHCDKLLARCLRMEDGNLEKAIMLVKAYHSATGHIVSWNAIFQPSRFIDSYNQGDLMITSQRSQDGRIVFISRTGMWEPEKITFDQAIAGTWMLLQYITAVSEDTQRNGIVTIWDFNGYSMKHTWAVNKRRIPSIVKLVQNHTVGTINEFHAINHPKIFRIFFSSFIKPFLRESLQKWIFFHDDVASLHSHFDKNGLPTFLGGNQEVKKCMDWDIMKKFYDEDQYFIDMMNDRFPRY